MGNKKKGNRHLLITLLLIVLACSLGISALFAKSVMVSTKPDTAQEKPGSCILVLEPFVVNLYDPHEFHYLKVSLQIEIAKSSEETAKAKVPVIQDAIVMILSGKSTDTFRNTEAKLLFKEEVRQRIGRILGDSVKDIYITDFMMQ